MITEKEAIKTVSEKIKQIRESLGFSIRDFASELGVSPGVISNIEYGRLQYPEKKMPLFRHISDTFGVPLDWILSDDPGPVPLPEMSKMDTETKKVGDLVVNDPIVKSYLEFRASRTEKEKAMLDKAFLDFCEILKQNMGE